MHRIGILTSGGDAPGMNAAIRSAVRTCIRNDVVAVGIHRGYNGLMHSDYVELNSTSVSGIISKGGTILYTARCEDFKTPAGLKTAAENCRYLGLDGLIAIGGDGTFRGALALTRAGINTIAIPATIDNDIGCTHYSIGFDTASNTAVSIIDKLTDTMQSHERTSIVEVMGHGAGHLATEVGLSVGATAILVPEKPFDFNRDIAEKIRNGKYRGKHHHIIVVSEGTVNTMELARRIESELGVDARVTIIGHIQRGGSPTMRDRDMATRMGHFAVNSLLEGQGGQVVCYLNSEIVLMPIEKALKIKKPLDEYKYLVAGEVSS